MLETIRMHSRGARWIAVLMVIAVLLATAQMIVDRQWGALLRDSGPLGLLLLGTWAALWTPYVECSPAQLTLNNVFYRITVPWTSVQELDTRFGLRVVTRLGTFSAWSASRTTNRRGSEAPAPQIAESTWAELKAAGHLDQPLIENRTSPTSLRSDVLVAAGVLLVWTAITWNRGG